MQLGRTKCDCKTKNKKKGKERVRNKRNREEGMWDSWILGGRREAQGTQRLVEPRKAGAEQTTTPHLKMAERGSARKAPKPVE